MSELRARARVLYNALNFDTPVNFGQDELFPKGLGEDKYVDNLHGGAERDPVQELANQIDLSESAGAYLFTGNRGTGKTTELLRLATILREYDCEVFYADMADYLTYRGLRLSDQRARRIFRENRRSVQRRPGKAELFRAPSLVPEFERPIHRD
jgi:hypothetical protein